MPTRSNQAEHVKTEGVSVRIASDRTDLFSAFELIYQAYLKTNLCERNPYSIRVTGYQTLPTTEVLIATRRENVVCTLSIVGDGLLGLPMESLYHDEVEARRDTGASLAEISCLAQSGEDGSFPTIVRLISLLAHIAKSRGLDEVLIAVHPRHARFYSRFLGFRAIGEVRSYGAVCDNPAVPMSLDVNNLATNHPRGHATLYGKPMPSEVVRYRPIPDALLDEIQFLAAETSGHSIGTPAVDNAVQLAY